MRSKNGLEKEKSHARVITWLSMKY